LSGFGSGKRRNIKTGVADLTHELCQGAAGAGLLPGVGGCDVDRQCPRQRDSNGSYWHAREHQAREGDQTKAEAGNPNNKSEIGLGTGSAAVSL